MRCAECRIDGEGARRFATPAGTRMNPKTSRASAAQRAYSEVGRSRQAASSLIPQRGVSGSARRAELQPDHSNRAGAGNWPMGARWKRTYALAIGSTACIASRGGCRVWTSRLFEAEELNRAGQAPSDLRVRVAERSRAGSAPLRVRWTRVPGELRDRTRERSQRARSAGTRRSQQACSGASHRLRHGHQLGGHWDCR